MKSDTIVLINPKLSRRPAEFLALGCLAAVCREKGYEVKVIDASCQNLSTEEIIENLKLLSSALVGITITEFSMNDADILLKSIKGALSNTHITVGGYFPSFNINYMLENYSMIDSVVYGEGEKTFLELVEAVVQGIQWKQIKGLAFIDETGIVKINPPQKLVENLDELPFPARDTLQYIKSSSRNIPHMYTSRGCQGRCTFCSIHPFYGLSEGCKSWRARSAEKVVDELCFLKEKYNCDEVIFFDDNFIGPSKRGLERAKKIAQEILDRGLKIRFSIATRLDNIDYETFSLLKQAGLWHVFIGVESAVQRILNIYNKGMKVEQISKGIDILKQIGLSVEIGFIMFNPFISFHEVVENYNFLNKIRKGIMITTLNLELEVYRGQKMEHILREQGLLREYRDYFFRYQFEDPYVEQVYIHIKEKEEWFMECYNKIKDLKRYTLIESDSFRYVINQLYDQIQDFDFEYFKTVCSYVEAGTIDLLEDFRNTSKEKLTLLYEDILSVEIAVNNMKERMV